MLSVGRSAGRTVRHCWCTWGLWLPPHADFSLGPSVRLHGCMPRDHQHDEFVMKSQIFTHSAPFQLASSGSAVHERTDGAEREHSEQEIIVAAMLTSMMLQATQQQHHGHVPRTRCSHAARPVLSKSMSDQLHVHNSAALSCTVLRNRTYCPTDVACYCQVNHCATAPWTGFRLSAGGRNAFTTTACVSMYGPPSRSTQYGIDRNTCNTARFAVPIKLRQVSSSGGAT